MTLSKSAFLPFIARVRSLKEAKGRKKIMRIAPEQRAPRVNHDDNTRNAHSPSKFNRAADQLTVHIGLSKEVLIMRSVVERRM